MCAIRGLWKGNQCVHEFLSNLRADGEAGGADVGQFDRLVGHWDVLTAFSHFPALCLKAVICAIYIYMFRMLSLLLLFLIYN